jgi:hypothetical protein
MVDLRDVKVGDAVFVVPQKQRHGNQEPGFIAVVSKVARKYAIANHNKGNWNRIYEFVRESGASKESPDSNLRVNGFGFDVYHSESEFFEAQRRHQIRTSLPGRIVDRWGRMKIMPHACIERIHAILNEYGVE